jgi:SAM-dependent methyltransferase
MVAVSLGAKIDSSAKYAICAQVINVDRSGTGCGKYQGHTTCYEESAPQTPKVVLFASPRRLPCVTPREDHFLSKVSQTVPLIGFRIASERTMERNIDLSFVAAPHLGECKVCQGPSPLFGVVDFHKSCIEAEGRRLAISGCPVYYRRCQHCAFTFTNAFDLWTKENFRQHIYNELYVTVDPDFVELRPSGNAKLIAESFQASRLSLQILDFGGGTGLLARRLRDQGFSATTYDPFSNFDVMPSDKFDLISCFEVLEHVPFPTETVAGMVSLLKSSGAILFSTLLQPSVFEQIGLNWWYASPRNGHVSLYSTPSLAHLFKRHDMKVASFSEGLHIAYAQVPSFAAHLKLPH